MSKNGYMPRTYFLYEELDKFIHYAVIVLSYFMKRNKCNYERDQ